MFCRGFVRAWRSSATPVSVRNHVVNRIIVSCNGSGPNHAFNRSRRYGSSTWRSPVAAGRLTWSR